MLGSGCAGDLPTRSAWLEPFPRPAARRLARGAATAGRTVAARRCCRSLLALAVIGGADRAPVRVRLPRQRRGQARATSSTDDDPYPPPTAAGLAPGDRFDYPPAIAFVFMPLGVLPFPVAAALMHRDPDGRDGRDAVRARGTRLALLRRHVPLDRGAARRPARRADPAPRARASRSAWQLARPGRPAAIPLAFVIGREAVPLAAARDLAARDRARAGRAAHGRVRGRRVRARLGRDRVRGTRGLPASAAGVISAVYAGRRLLARLRPCWPSDSATTARASARPRSGSRVLALCAIVGRRRRRPALADPRAGGGARALTDRLAALLRAAARADRHRTAHVLAPSGWSRCCSGRRRTRSTSVSTGGSAVGIAVAALALAGSWRATRHTH